MQKEFTRLRQLIDAHLETYFTEDCPQKKLTEAMRYSLLAGGKRIRPVLVLQFCKASGGSPDAALPFAAAVEMLHTYSLIHDDLPCMDNDDLRRGKPTNHKIYGECTATLAGDALQAVAFGTLLKAQLPPESVIKAGQISKCRREKGICGGQLLDMEGEGSS
jgi:geranylgeranyl diphosphate synthase type II